MIDIINKYNCSGCHACASVCPKRCISMDADEEGFWYPAVDKEKCVDCGLCEKVCPIIHKTETDEARTPAVFAAINKNDEVRLRSSSGGIFTLLAEYIISQGGAVFGAAFADDLTSVHHICVSDTSELDKLRGAKYVQSRIGDTYMKAKELLDEGRKVLFTGTPCQISGLYSYLGKDHDGLYTQDIICHGVPSPMVWEKYLRHREKEASSAAREMHFRHKRYGWKTFSVFLEFANKKKYIKTLGEDPYMRTFLRNLCLRPSCYKCSFKSVSRRADITLADFWGIEDVMPEMDDDKGTSLVLVHSPKGQELFDGIGKYMRCERTSWDAAEKYNTAAVRSVPHNDKRSEFFMSVSSEDFDGQAAVLCGKPHGSGAKERLKRALIDMGIFETIRKVKNRI